MDYDLLYPGRFLKSGEFEGKDRTLKIVGVRVEELEQDKGGLRGKGIVTFEDEKKELVLNKTNGICLKAMWGRETDAWIGKRLTLYPAPHYDNFTKTQGTAIRVRGSPDLPGPLSVVIKLRKKKDTTMTLVRTGGPARSPNGQTQAKPQPNATQAAAIVIRKRIKAALEKHDLRGQPALDFVQRITGKAVGHDANEAGLIESALEAEFATPPADPEPRP